MWIKGSGGDIGTLTRKGIAGLYTKRLRDLKNVYQGLEDEDRMVGLFNHCIYDLESRAPSIDTPLHGLLPFKHIDHLHPDGLIAIAASANSQEITREIWGDTMGWVGWQRPGFDLGLQLEKCYEQQPGIRGIVLESHGLFTWADDAHEYLNSLEVIEQASLYIEEKSKSKNYHFGGKRVDALDVAERKMRAAQLLPLLRGLCSTENQMIGHFDDSDVVLGLSTALTLTDWHLWELLPRSLFRTKIQPLVLPLDQDENLEDTTALLEKLRPSFERYKKEYVNYYNSHKNEHSPNIRDASPVILLYPGSLFSFAKNKQTARVVDFTSMPLMS